MNFLNKKILFHLLGASLILSTFLVPNNKTLKVEAAPTAISMPTRLNIKPNTDNEVRKYYSS